MPWGIHRYFAKYSAIPRSMVQIPAVRPMIATVAAVTKSVAARRAIPRATAMIPFSFRR